MKRCRFALILSFVLLVAAGCSGLPGLRVETLIPEDKLPTVVELTAQALIDQGLVTPPPTSTIDPDAVTPTSALTDTPTITSTPLDSPTPTLNFVISTPEPLKIPNPLPQAEIQIISPGRLSRVLSPFRLHLYLIPPRNDRGEDMVYQVSLYGENGRLVNRETVTRTPEESKNPHLILYIEFNISGQAESARLEISSIDPYNRVTAVKTTDVILLGEGDQEIKTILNLYADMIIQQPVPSTLIQGDKLTVKGLTRIAPSDELLVECVNRDGNQIGSAVIEVDQEDLGDGYRAFEGEVPFQVGYSSWIRVQVIARDGKFSGILTLSSVEVLVSP
jgi:hypothetical protein